jgi:predicted DNA-binding ribbon-helix-helix protein
MTRTRQPRRGRTALPEGERKDRLIQTRVAGDLDDALRDEAKKQRLTVSQLIRNLLEDTFHLVDGIVANTANLTAAVRRDALRLAASAKGGAARPAGGAAAKGAGTTARGGAGTAARRVAVSSGGLPAAVQDVDAWQEVVVGRESVCDGCSKPLGRGEKALLGLLQGGSHARVWLCPACAARL